MTITTKVGVDCGWICRDSIKLFKILLVQQCLIRYVFYHLIFSCELIFLSIAYFYFMIIIYGQSWRSDTRCVTVTVKPTVCGFDPHSTRWNIYLNLYFHFFALVTRINAALSSATQHALQNSATERSALTLGSLCLPWCMRDTAWSWLKKIYDSITCPELKSNSPQSRLQQPQSSLTKKWKQIFLLYILFVLMLLKIHFDSK